MDKKTKIYDETRNRIFALIEEQKISQKEFADRLQVSSQTITDWKKGKSNSFMRNLDPIAQILQTTPIWLFYGTGEKFLSNEQRKKQEQLRLSSTITAVTEYEKQVKSEVKDILQQKAREFGIPLTELLGNNKQLISYFDVTTNELPGTEKEPTPVSESGPLYPPEYDLLSPEDKELVDNMIRSLAKKK